MPRAKLSTCHPVRPGGDRSTTGAPAASNPARSRVVVALPTANPAREPATPAHRKHRQGSKPAATTASPVETRPAERQAAAPPADLTPDPGGYIVCDAPSISATGRPEEVGRVVRVGAGFEAWNRVESSGYSRLGTFPDGAAAREALGRRAVRAVTENRPKAKAPGSAARRRAAAKA